ncbi:MAG: hypothetical protein R2762_13680 [Bryobacteraceae bacterium]
MLLLHSPSAAVAAVLIAVLTWALCGITFKASRCRFEIYAWDFFTGAALIAVLAFFTVGTQGQGVTAPENLAIVEMDLLGPPLLAGAVTALGLYFAMALASIAGVAPALLATGGIACSVHLLESLWTAPRVDSNAAHAAALLALAAAGLAFVAIASPRAEGVQPSGRRTALSVTFGIAGGLFLGLPFRVMGVAHSDEIGLQAYPLALLITLGAFGSAIIYGLFFINLPVRHEPIAVARFFRAPGQHAAGLAGGALWGLGLVLLLLTLDAPPDHGLSAHGAAIAAYGSAVLGAGFGLLYRAERQTRLRVALLCASIGAFVAALGLRGGALGLLGGMLGIMPDG